MKDDLIDLANLAVHFLASCDKYGEINLLATPPSEILFQRDAKEINLLRSCKINANEETWFSECVEICNNFRLFEYPEYFESHLKTAVLYRTWGIKRIAEIKSKTITRILEEKKSIY